MTVTPVTPGDTVRYADPHGRAHHALVTAVHGTFPTGEDGTYTREDLEERYSYLNDEEQKEEWISRQVGQPGLIPCINVVFVVHDNSKTDSYGRQIERATSVQHRSQTTAHGFWWD